MIQVIGRRRISLNGRWEFQVDPMARLTCEELAPDRTIRVPGAWQSEHEDLHRYDGVAWYQRSVDLGRIEPGQAPQTAILHLGAVDYACQVWVNGQPAGEHVGGYTPVELLVGHLLRAGENTITVRVEDHAYEQVQLARWPGTATMPRAADIPHGKQGWYLDVSGIWGEAWLDLAAELHVARVHVTSDLRAGRARVHVWLRTGDPNLPGRGSVTPGDGAIRLSVSVAPRGGQAVATREVPVTAAEAMFDLPVPNPRYWEPDDPFLYEATATITRDGEPIDGLRTHFGMREITIRDGRLWLNGRPLYLRAALDQDFYPETIYTPPSEDVLRSQFQLAKEMGLNCLRVHIKPADPRYLDLCDEMGLLVWAELPSWRTIWHKERLDSRVSLPEELQQEIEQLFREMVARDFNHPSIIIWTLVNEDWGTQLIFSPSDRAWLRGFYERAKAIDPTRLVVDNSPCFSAHGPNFHVQSDLDDFHIYAAMPERYRNLAGWLRDFAHRPAWSYSTFGDAVRRGDEPLLISEFGTWGLPRMAALRQHWREGEAPWWWNTGAWWGSLGGEMSYPAGVEERFAASGLTAIWPDYDSFAEATQRLEGAALKAQIELIRREPAIQGYVITEFSDIYWEANGLVDFYRQPKAFHESLPVYNSADILIPVWQRASHWGGELLRLPLVFSHWSGRATGACRVRWSIPALGLEGGWPVPAVEIGETRPIGAVVARLPDVAGGRQLWLDLWLEREDGTVISRSYHDFVLLSRLHRDPRSDVVLLVNDRGDNGLAGHTGDAFDSGDTSDVVEAGGPAPIDSGEIDRPSSGGGAPAELAGFSASLPRLGYRITTDPKQAGLLVATELDAGLLNHVRTGGALLFLPHDVSPFLPVVARGSLRDGNWISAFHWLRPDLPLSVPVDNPLGFAFTDVLPRNVVLGHGTHMSRDVLAGLVTGWVHLPAATICQFRYGQGRVVMSTWQLRRSAERDPIATALLHDLIAYTVSDRCQPKTAL